MSEPARTIYLDYNASTPIDPRVAAIMLNVSFVGRVGADTLAAFDGVTTSTGAACHADSVELSPVLQREGCATRCRDGCRPSQARAHDDEG
jgi:cysteine sulfinate desulfinase/cysteine desulfurase-like protein